MKRAIISDNKKTRGRPATGTGLLIGLRWHEAELEAIDEWRRHQDELPSRPDAIRRLVAIGLAAPAPKGKGQDPTGRFWRRPSLAK
jgi:hypothetical protein